MADIYVEMETYYVQNLYFSGLKFKSSKFKTRRFAQRVELADLLLLMLLCAAVV